MYLVLEDMVQSTGFGVEKLKERWKREYMVDIDVNICVLWIVGER